MQEYNIQGIVTWDDVIKPLKEYFNFLKTNKISIESLQESKMDFAKNKLELTPDELRKFSLSNFDLYKNYQNESIREMLMKYITVQVYGGQVLYKNLFNFLNERIELLEKEFPINFSLEDKFVMANKIREMLFDRMNIHSTIMLNEYEKEVVEKYKKIAEENTKKNRAFGRETKVMDSIEKKGNK